MRRKSQDPGFAAVPQDTVLFNDTIAENIRCAHSLSTAQRLLSTAVPASTRCRTSLCRFPPVKHEKRAEQVVACFRTLSSTPLVRSCPCSPLHSCTRHHTFTQCKLLCV
jgi:hypothetical protein